MEIQGRDFDLTKIGDAIIAGALDVCESIAAKAEQYAHDNAGWTDRTHDVRNMMQGQVIDDGHDIGFRVVHRAKSLGKKRVRDTENGKEGEIYGAGILYGKYLEGWDEDKQELTHKGKYPILKETVDHFNDEFLRRIKEVVKNKGRPF
jgi:hypothetical protein